MLNLSTLVKYVIMTLNPPRSLGRNTNAVDGEQKQTSELST